MDDLDALGAWLKAAQGVELAPARLRDPAAAAARLGALAGAAAKTLPFGAEPSGFLLAQRRLTRRGDPA